MKNDTLPPNLAENISSQAGDVYDDQALSRAQQRIQELQKANEQSKNARLSALNLMEDAVLTREALRESEAWLEGQKEAFLEAVSDAPLEKSLAVLIRTAEKQMDDMRCTFYLADPERRMLRHVVGMQIPASECEDGLRIGPDAPSCGLAVHSGAPVITPDVREEPAWKPWLTLAEKYDFRGCWSFPVKIDQSPQGTLGTFAMYFKTPRKATQKDQEFATTLTRAATIIISRYREAEDRKRAEAALRRSEKRQILLLQLADLLRDMRDVAESQKAAAKFLAEYLAADRVIYAEQDTEENDVVVRPGYGPEGAGNLAGNYPIAEFRNLLALLQTGDALVVDDVESAPAIPDSLKAACDKLGIHSFVAVPFFKDFRYHCVLCVMSSRRGPWHSLDVSLIKDVAVRTWLAMARIKAEEQVEKSREDLWVALQETERARAEAETAGRVKDHFLAVLSHELRTPLTPVMMAAQTLLRRKDLPASVYEALEMIDRNIHVESRFIEDLLDVTRIGRGKLELHMEPLDLHEVLKKAMEVSLPDMEAKGQITVVALDADRHELPGDFLRLEQVFWNLLKNASKFSPAASEIHISSRNAGGNIEVTISDAGVGFLPEKAKEIFDAFKQANEGISRKFGGLGLGLAIAKASVEGHGGTLSASSDGEGRGAKFVVSLPIAPDEQTKKTPHIHSTGGPLEERQPM